MPSDPQEKEARPCFKAYGPLGWLAVWNDAEKFGELLPHLIHGLEKTISPQLQEYVPGHQSILLLFHQPQTLSTARQLIFNAMQSPQPVRDGGSLLQIPVRYNGPDLSSVAAATGLSPTDVIAIHCQPTYTVRFMGFSPGFPYLEPLDPRLHIPRKNNPAKSVPAGSVAIGGPHTGIYPSATAGGWHILGFTDTPLFDKSKATTTNPANCFLLRPGDQLRFVPVANQPCQ